MRWQKFTPLLFYSKIYFMTHNTSFSRIILLSFLAIALLKMPYAVAQQPVFNQNAVNDAKKQAEKLIEENLGTLNTVEQQQQKITKAVDALLRFVDEVIQEIQTSSNFTQEQKQEMINTLNSVKSSLTSCKTAVNADGVDTQDELNSAYKVCVEHLKAAIQEFKEAVIQVMLMAIEEILKYQLLYLQNTEKVIQVLDSVVCKNPNNPNSGLIDPIVTDLRSLVSQAYPLYNQLQEMYKAIEANGVNFNQDYTQALKAMKLAKDLSVVDARILEELEDGYDSCPAVSGTVPLPTNIPLP